MKIALAVGGDGLRLNISYLAQGSDIIVCTPGRLLHLLKDGSINTGALAMVVLDEIGQLLSKSPAKRQSGEDEVNLLNQST